MAVVLVDYWLKWVIAHCLSTNRNADQVNVIQDEVVARGKHAELLAQGG